MQSLSLHTQAALNSALAPRLQKAVRLLQLSSVDFAHELRDMAGRNPFLDHEEPAANDSEEDVLEDTAADWQSCWGFGNGPSRPNAEDGDGVFGTLQSPASLASHLLSQLNVLPLSRRDLAVAVALVGCLEDDGYLRMPLADVAQALEPAEAACDEEELHLALLRVQALDPAGVGARDLPECLSLQLGSIRCEKVRARAADLLANHAGAVANGDTRSLARLLQCEPAEVDSVLAALKRLDPHPGWRYCPPATSYVTPDVIARKRRGRWVAVLNDGVVPKLRINQRYVELFQQNRSAEHSMLAADLQEARWTLRNVEQRFSTILGVAQAILERQKHFLAYGAMAMKPLALKEIAQELGVHESTVSRVTNNKFMATPCGVFELKFFFSRGLSTASGGECSPTAIRGLIQEIVTSEKPDAPLSDVDIARTLQQQGLQVARRTVTKYRQLLRILPAERRRTFAG